MQLVADIQFRQAYDTLSNYIKKGNFQGWDLFDGLNSQIFKHSPINFRRIALVPKGYNAKGLGLFALGLSLSRKLEEEKKLQ